jgi:hypothetical protein
MAAFTAANPPVAASMVAADPAKASTVVVAGASTAVEAVASFTAAAEEDTAADVAEMPREGRRHDWAGTRRTGCRLFELGLTVLGLR